MKPADRRRWLPEMKAEDFARILQSQSSADALRDLTEVLERLGSKGMSAKERNDWEAIRNELVQEVRRLALHLRERA